MLIRHWHGDARDQRDTDVVVASTHSGATSDHLGVTADHRGATHHSDATDDLRA